MTGHILVRWFQTSQLLPLIIYCSSNQPNNVSLLHNQPVSAKFQTSERGLSLYNWLVTGLDPINWLVTGLDAFLLYYYYSQTLDKYKYYILCIFYTWLASLTSRLEFLTSQAELAFWLVRITTRAELARYLNEPERAESSQFVIQP